MNVVEAQDALTVDGGAQVIIVPANEGTSEAFLQVFLQREASHKADGPFMVKATKATRDDVVASLDELRAAVEVLAAIND